MNSMRSHITVQDLSSGKFAVKSCETIYDGDWNTLSGLQGLSRYKCRIVKARWLRVACENNAIATVLVRREVRR